MKRINRLVTVLILVAGISVFGITEGRTLNKDEKLLADHQNEYGEINLPPIIDNVLDKLSELSGCVEFTTRQFESDLAEGRSRGDLGGVIKKYCRKVPAIEACVRNITEIIEPSADSEERKIFTGLIDITELILDYMCLNDGYRITSFLENDGPECVESKGRGLGLCAFENFEMYLNDLIKNSLPTGEDSCSTVRNFQECSLTVLTGCDDPTPAKIVDSLLEYLLKVVQCDKLLYFHVFGMLLTAPVANDKPEGQLMRLARTKCAANGGPQAFYSLYEHVNGLVECSRSVIGKVQIAHERFTSDWREPTVVEFFERYCNHVPELEQCAKRFKDSLKTCLDPAERETADIIYKSGKSALQFLCDTEAEVFTEFADTGGPECFLHKLRSVGDCFEQSFDSYLPSKSGSGRFETPFIITGQDCTDIKKLQECVTEVLMECEDQTPAVDFFESLMESLLEPTPCVDFFETHTSPNSELVLGKSKSKFYKSFEDKCQINGGPAAFDNAIKSMNFVSLTIDRPTSTPDFRTGEDTAVLPLVYDRFCRRGPILIELEKYLTKSFKPCLEPEEHDFLDIIDNVTSSSVRLICENNGEFLAALLNPDGEECLNSKMEDVLICGSEAFGIDVNEKFIALNRYDRPLVLTAEHCTNLEKFRECSVEVLAECDQLTTSHLTDYLLKYIEDATPCKNLLQAESSSSTEWSPGSTEQEEDEFGIEVFLSLLPGKSDWNFLRRSWNKSFREMCFENGGVAAYEATIGLPKYIQNGVTTLQMSLRRLNSEINDARGRGREQLDAVFFKYCDDFPSVKEYLKHVADSVKPCLDQELRGNVDFIHNTIESPLRFMCEDDGERLASFVGTGGVKCMAENFEPVGDCIAKFSNPVFSPERPFVLGVEQCQAMRSVEHCIIEVMDDCDSQEPADMIRIFTDFLFDQWKCADDIPKGETLSSSYFQIGQAIAHLVG